MSDPVSPAGTSVDGVQKPAAQPPLQQPVSLPASVSAAKRGILGLGSVAYIAYVVWCASLLTMFPDPAAGNTALLRAGIVSVALVGLGLLGVSLFALRRIGKSATSTATRRLSIIKLSLAVVPLLALSAIVPPAVLREPPLPLDIVDPTDPSRFVAPVTVTLSAERAVEILRKRGLKVIKFQWDTDGDGKQNDETVLPRTTVLYQKQGVYPAKVRVLLDGGTARTLTKRVVVPQQVFSVEPPQPVVEKPVKFSLNQLISDVKQLKQVTWDYGDGTPSQTLVSLDTAHTYYATGDYVISATVQLQNQSQTLYKKTVTVTDPPPLPFAITLNTEPKTLVGPPPFGVIFKLDTKEKLRDVSWTFGDGKDDRGPSLVRESHSFDAAGIYSVVVRARSDSGSLAELNAIVRVTDLLSLRDLKYEGSPAVVNNGITGEVPLEVSLTPQTTTPLVQFSWETPDDPNIQVEDGTLKAVFRSEGTYVLTLVAQGAEGKSMRQPITVTVQPPSAEPAIQMKPDGGAAPLAVSFDASQSFIPPNETIAGFKWLFGDEGQGGRNPQLGGARVQHTYKAPGEYTVKLSIVLASGKEFTAERTLIVRRPTLSSCITPSRLTAEEGKGIEFDSSCSTGAADLLWDVRNDDEPSVILAQSEEPSYIYVFEKAGEYTVTLTAKDAWGGQEKSSVHITVTPP